MNTLNCYSIYNAKIHLNDDFGDGTHHSYLSHLFTENCHIKLSKTFCNSQLKS